MEIVTKVMEKSWKSHGNLLVKMCTNPVISIHIDLGCNGVRTEPKLFTGKIQNGSYYPYPLGVGTLE